jgi:excisionase family DNA binding protein
MEVPVSRLMSLQEAARHLSVSTFTVRRLVRSSQLKSVRVCRRVLIPEAEIERAVKHGCAPAAIESIRQDRRKLSKGYTTLSISEDEQQ